MMYTECRNVCEIQVVKWGDTNTPLTYPSYAFAMQIIHMCTYKSKRLHIAGAFTLELMRSFKRATNYSPHGFFFRDSRCAIRSHPSFENNISVFSLPISQTFLIVNNLLICDNRKNRLHPQHRSYPYTCI